MSAPGDQSATLALLRRPELHGGVEPELIETHVSLVVLGPHRVFKLKKAVRFPYLDFSTLAAREAACRAEVTINRRTAPRLYRGVRPVVKEASGAMVLGDDGDTGAVDWVVEMARFEDGDLLSDALADGRFDGVMAERLAEAIWGFHTEAAVITGRGCQAGVLAIIENNQESFLSLPEGLVDPVRVARLTSLSRATVTDLASFLDARKDGGFVRHCHGDLHLRNICLIEGQPTLFDAIEFNEEFAHIDVLYDLAFLLMDLDHLGAGVLSTTVLNRYLDCAPIGPNGSAALALLPLFMSMRAAIRAHVGGAKAASMPHGPARADETHGARAYLDRAITYLTPKPPVLIGIGGLSGSGKSVLARTLAPDFGPAPGARLIRSDAIRKRLFSAPLNARLPDEAYQQHVTEQVYDAALTEAGAALKAGHAVIFDAVNVDPRRQRQIQSLAEDLAVDFSGLWLDVPDAVRLARVEGRTHDISDADVRIAAQQSSSSIATMDWDRIDASGTPAQTRSRALSRLSASGLWR